jgi:hypothetical protein
MAADPPLSRLVLTATSIADDLGYVALSDLSNVLSSEGSDYRIIGGHMVTALVARWRLVAGLYRETGDTDLGVPPVVVRDHHLIERLQQSGYEKIEGNRFARKMTDVPVEVVDGARPPRLAIIDVLVPAYTSRARQNHRISENLVTSEVPGLAAALRSDPVTMTLELHRLNGDILVADLSFPNEVAALILKALATRVRDKATDVVDVWRCLEVAFAAGVELDEVEDPAAGEAATIVRALFADRRGPGMQALASEQRLSDRAGDERFTRVRALIARVLGNG